MVIFLLKNDVFLAFRPGNSGKKSYAPPLFRPGNSGKKAMHPPFFRPGNSGFSKSTRPSFSHLRVKNAKKWPKMGFFDFPSPYGEISAAFSREKSLKNGVFGHQFRPEIVDFWAMHPPIFRPGNCGQNCPNGSKFR